jgi:hypothetical protein
MNRVRIVSVVIAGGALAGALAWSVLAQEFPTSRTAPDSEFTIPAGEYSAIVVGSRGGSAPEFRLRLGRDEFRLAVADGRMEVISFAHGLRVRDDAAVMVRRARGGGEAFAWGIATVGPVAFPARD